MAMATTATTTSIMSVILEVAGPEAAHCFYVAFGVDTHVCLRASEVHSAGFRGFTLALTVAGSAIVDGFLGAAVGAGATVLKPAVKLLWGYGGVVRAPDGTIWKIAASVKKDTGPATREAVRVQWHLTPLPDPPSPDDRCPTLRGNDHPLRRLGPDHRRCRPARHCLTTGPKPGAITARNVVRHPHARQRDNALGILGFVEALGIVEG